MQSDKNCNYEINNLGEFIRLDHIKKRKNLELYGQSVPPRYNLSNVQTKLHFLYGTNDVVANPKVCRPKTKIKSNEFFLYLKFIARMSSF